MSRRPAVQFKNCVSLCCGVGLGAMGSGIVPHGIGRVCELNGLALLSGLPSKVAMVMMTFSAFLVEKHVA